MNKITLAPIGKTAPKPRPRPKLSDEARARKAALMRANNADPEYQARRLERLAAKKREQMADPEFRAWLDVHMAKMRKKGVPATRLHNYAKWEDPEYRAKMSQMLRDMHKRPGFREAVAKRVVPPEAQRNNIAAVKRSWDRRRGFKVPPSMRADYRNLTVTKKMRAREAGRILGLI